MERLSSVFLIKKWGILIEKEFESPVITGLKIPRDYDIRKGEKKICKMRLRKTNC